MSLKKNSKVDVFSYAGTKIKGSVPQTYFEIKSKELLQDLSFECVVLILGGLEHMRQCMEIHNAEATQISALFPVFFSTHSQYKSDKF